MTAAIMQPYFLPYIGYFQLINVADKFVVYDNIKFTKKSWINRNRFLMNGKPEYFTIPLKNASDFLTVSEREISADFLTAKNKILRRFENAYKKAPFFNETFLFVKEIFENESVNLFKFVHNSILKVCELLEIKTEIIISSHVEINHALKGKEKVISICKKLNANRYVNPQGGINLYDKNEFLQNGIQLSFLFPKGVEYKQFGDEFIPNLSIIDVLMFNGTDKTREFLGRYELK